MPKAVIDKANTRHRMEGPAHFFKDVDLNGPLMSRFITDLARRKTLVDRTIVIFEGMLTQDGGKPHPAYVPYMGIISPVLERSAFTSGGYPLVEGFTRDDYRKSYAKMIELVGMLHKAGVPILAGTDGWGIELVRELEIYQQAGFTPAEALQSATILPARVVGADKRTGSIAVGKEAGMVLVDGDPSKELGALRRVLVVVSDNYVMDADELRKAAATRHLLTACHAKTARPYWGSFLTVLHVAGRALEVHGVRQEVGTSSRMPLQVLHQFGMGAKTRRDLRGQQRRNAQVALGWKADDKEISEVLSVAAAHADRVLDFARYDMPRIAAIKCVHRRLVDPRIIGGHQKRQVGPHGGVVDVS